MAKLPDDRRAAFTAAYRFYEEHWDMPDTVEAWTQCTKDVADVCAENGNTILIKELTMACFNAVDTENAEARRLINGKTVDGPETGGQ